VARDPGMLYFDARLSVDQPTVEVRVCDVCTDPGLAVGIVALVRALVETAARDWEAGRPLPHWRAEALRAAQWRASRFGMADALVDPRSRVLAPARAVVESLVDHVRPALEESGDLDRVTGLLERAVSDNGATRQRAAFERTGEVSAVVEDLIARTEDSWRTPVRA
jgi:glutamate---cysteine ligase / carboxylate-amine ligase